MAFHYLTGTTTLGAANAVNDWFATFEAWIRDVVGWTIVAGAGTDNLRISSIGESGLMTFLFAHVWRTAGTENVRTEVSDDGIPTHETTRGAPDLESQAARFRYFMAADLDAIVIVWKSHGGYYMRYAGLVMPFAQNAPDERYYMVSTDGMLNSTILRNFAGAWDQNDSIFYNDYMQEMGPDRDNGEVVLGACYHGDRTEIAGQFKHISSRFLTLSVNEEDAITSTHPGGTSTWIVLNAGSYTFAMRTGGQLPPGPPETNFAYATGNAAAIGNWYIALTNFMLGNGWAAIDLSGITGFPFDWEYNSPGELGTDDIWVRCYFNVNVAFEVADSAYGTPGRHAPAWTSNTSWTVAIFPANYHFAGDADCLLCTIDDGVWYVPLYAGKVYPAVYNLSSVYMNVVCANMDGAGITVRRILYGHGGAFNEPITYNYYADGNSAMASNPNAYDGVTYLVWGQCPAIFLTAPPGNRHELVGVMKYFGASDGGGIAQLDTIQDGAEIFTIFSCVHAAAARFWTMRTDALGGGVNFPGRRLYPNDGNPTISPILDGGTLTKVPPSTIERGNTAADFNMLVRGHSKRIDIIPGH